MFKMTVKDVYSLTGLGIAAAGKIEAGNVKFGDTLTLSTASGKRQVRVLKIDLLRGTVTEAFAGPDDVGICISDVKRGEIKSGDVLSSP